MRPKLLILLVLAAAPALRAAEFDVRPTPSWAEAATLPPAGAGRAGVAGILTDHQVRVNGTSVDEYFRRVRKVDSAAGVQNASELGIDFDPSYQRLVLHDVALVRGARRINQLDVRGVRIIEKEPDSNEKIYDGELTALLFLKDVRPGDVIDYSYSLEGANPLLGGKYADEFDFYADVPTALMRHRLVWPAARPLHVRGGAAIEHRGAVDVYTWTRNNVDAVDDEDSTPDWYDGFDSVQVSEFASWAEVAKWSEEMFRPDLASQAEVAAIADKIRGEHPTRDAQITAAIRFVQDDIRYLGIEMGRGSHEPRQPRATLEQRYGDCKDKAFLLAQLLQRLGVEAHPAMVNTKLRHRLDEFLPSPFLFDHAITEVIDGKHTYWIDGTIAEQGGRLETIDTPNDERALVVSTTTTALSKIDTHNRANTTIDETYDIHGDDAALAVTTTYRGRDADDLRADLATRSAAEYAKERINLFASDHPRIERVAAPSITDDRDGDSIIVRERYVIHRIWKDGTWTFAPRAIEDHLARPDTLIRSMPLAVDYPLDVVENVTIHGGVISDADDVVTDTPALHYERHAGNGTVTWRLQTKKDAVSAREVADHLSTLNTLDDELGVTVRGRAQMASMSPWVVSPAVAIVLVVLTAVMSRRRRGITSQ